MLETLVLLLWILIEKLRKFRSNLDSSSSLGESHSNLLKFVVLEKLKEKAISHVQRHLSLEMPNFLGFFFHNCCFLSKLHVLALGFCLICFLDSISSLASSFVTKFIIFFKIRSTFQTKKRSWRIWSNQRRQTKSSCSQHLH